MAHSTWTNDLDERLERVGDLGHPLEVMNAIIDFEVFRPVPDRALKRSDRRKGGRPHVIRL
ncbi:MAG: hypothetical protein GDA39_06840 [Hyphomonadaceae bacterium]|nr:hypothetical protein [Hyphomonadaceae bacterium]MBC6412602.1 hypothetical protein [Hyphomonadaceae bacterium]